MKPINLLNLTNDEMNQFCVEEGESRFRGDQLYQWIHKFGCTDFESMSNISKTFRARLQAIAEIRAPKVSSEHISADGTIKWLLELDDGNAIETVFIPEASRGTLCVSSQVGCALNCSFCSTGAMGFNRNLELFEIIGQVWLAVRRLSAQQGKHDRHITNIVMMGMGEPLLNFDRVVNAMAIMMDDNAYGLAKRRVTLSTSGLVPEMQKLKQASDAALAVSLHAPTNPLRDLLVPINKKYPLEQLMPVCKDYFAGANKRYVTFEYVMLDGINDTPEHARQLKKCLAGHDCKVNLIPFNPFPGTIYRRSSAKTITKFGEILSNAGFNTITRRTRGDDVDAACGQLAGDFADRTGRSGRQQRIAVATKEKLGKLSDK